MNLFFELKPKAAAARGHPYWALYDWDYGEVREEYLNLTHNSVRVWEETKNGSVRLFKYAIDDGNLEVQALQKTIQSMNTEASNLHRRDEETMPPQSSGVDMAEFLMVKLSCRTAG